MEYLPTIGLEIHAELKTLTKMFCESRNDPDEARPNVNICPVCMGHPGTLPVINREAVKHVLRVGLALGGEIADFTEFDRKNYFYPDIPKGYQLSQYQYPLVRGGSLNGISITRVHLEEDTATSIHESREPSGREKESSLVDFNRAGVPLMELVTEPELHSAKDAADFARELQLVLRCLGASDANMEKGEMRVEANISVRPASRARDKKLGTKVEVKNLNSFRAVERAIEYEVRRHREMLESGGKVVQETRGWDEAVQETFPQRRKEESHDYRYFPDPDLPKLFLRRMPALSPDALRRELPELPSAKRARFVGIFHLKKEDADMLAANRALGNLFEAAAALLREPREIALAANYLTTDLAGILRKKGEDADGARFSFAPDSFAELMRMAAAGALSSRGVKDILAILFESGGEPRRLAQELNLVQKNDAAALRSVVDDVVGAHPKVAADYQSGKEAALQFLVGQGMKATKGSANPEVLRHLFAERLRR